MNGNDDVHTHIKLGSITFGHSLDDEELMWLVEKINDFLQQE